MISNKIPALVAKSYDGKTTKVSRNSQQKKSDAVTNQNDKEKPKERYISQDKKQEIIDDLRLM